MQTQYPLAKFSFCVQLIVLMDPHDDLEDILRVNRSREKHYVFDHTFSSEASQEEVYCAVVQEKGIIESVLSGYNCTVFAYGATGEASQVCVCVCVYVCVCVLFQFLVRRQEKNACLEQ